MLSTLLKVTQREVVSYITSRVTLGTLLNLNGVINVLCNLHKDQYVNVDIIKILEMEKLKFRGPESCLMFKRKLEVELGLEPKSTDSPGLLQWARDERW